MLMKYNEILNFPETRIRLNIFIIKFYKSQSEHEFSKMCKD